MRKDDEYGIEKYGQQAWENIVDNYNYENDGKLAFFMRLANDVNLRKISYIIKKAIGMEDISFSWSIETSEKKYPSLKIESDDLAKRKDSNLLNLAWRSFKIMNNGSWVVSNQKCSEYGKEDYYKERATEFHLTFELDFQYISHCGGYNGSSIGRFCIYKDRIEYSLDKDHYSYDEDTRYINQNKNSIVTVPFEME